MNTLECVLLCLFIPLLMFFIIDNKQYIPTKFDNYLAAWTVLYMETGFFFPLIERVMCTIQSYHLLDALIRYFA